MTRAIRIGTRGSPLALAQARMAATALRDMHGLSPAQIEIVPVTTTGDRIKDRPLAELGGKALWTKELDECLGDERIDISVHSMKDVESFRPAEFTIAAMLPRADVRDRLIGASGLDSIPRGARFGTSSPRRAAQLLSRRPDLATVPFRGNVETRLRKIEMGEADATLLAAAGLDRLDRRDVGVPLDDLLPAPAQGAVGIEIRTGDGRMRSLVAAIDHASTHICVSAERRLLMGLGGDCRSPIAALALLDDGRIHLRAEILSPDGSEVIRGERRFPVDDGEAPGQLAAELLGRASAALRSLFTG
ncbi:hydroxymethylbilane synthase [Sphingosinicella rhizophila]|uniref:Porphobilinogen deaminase n=1 Tax=Sphingosinicella rhizophila TaxID=3050082 RepID=A0ABU3Q8E0_9SPHN|nr:hydroxymethylbilane synthase [Sphingosinicella sp. GR2756]MDT9599592.1 hydroxymethylbilane synthase [Sphingosinicella sp. GR2756]